MLPTQYRSPEQQQIDAFLQTVLLAFVTGLASAAGAAAFKALTRARR